MRLRFFASLLVFISSYFPLVLIFIIKDLDDTTFYPSHPITAAIIAALVLIACAIVLLAARKIESGVPVKVLKVSNKSGDMFTYTIPYMISFYNFDLGDWKTLLSLVVFMSLMFALSYRTQNVFINPVLALAGYGLYDCQVKDGSREVQGLPLAQIFTFCARCRLFKRAVTTKDKSFLQSLIKKNEEKGWNLKIEHGAIVAEESNVDFILKLLNNERVESQINQEVFDAVVKKKVG